LEAILTLSENWETKENKKGRCLTILLQPWKVNPFNAINNVVTRKKIPNVQQKIIKWYIVYPSNVLFCNHHSHYV
jgi:hypothetical protein